jgi:hypothetical protein
MTPQGELYTGEGKMEKRKKMEKWAKVEKLEKSVSHRVYRIGLPSH